MEKTFEKYNGEILFCSVMAQPIYQGLLYALMIVKVMFSPVRVAVCFKVCCDCDWEPVCVVSLLGKVNVPMCSLGLVIVVGHVCSLGNLFAVI